MNEMDNIRGIRMQGDRETFLRLQKSLISLERGRYRVLDDDRFVSALAGYLFDLYRFRYFDFTHRILHILGECCLCGAPGHREKALFILSLFAEHTATDENVEVQQALSWIFSRWLNQEKEYLSCFEFVCRQIQTLLEKMLKSGMYCQLTNWLRLLYKIAHGVQPRAGAIQAITGRMHSSLIGALMLQEAGTTPETPYIKAEDAACLRRYYSEGGAVALVRELFTTGDKDRRLALISTLSRLDDSIAYELIENLEADSPWYMIRNAVQIISRLGNPRHFDLVQPFLGYPDIRVQQQMVAFIARLDSEKSLEQRLVALDVCDDSLKFQLIPKLSETGSKAAELALVNVLENISDVDPNLREELTLLLCSELSHFPTVRVVKSLQCLIDHRRRGEPEPDNDPVIIVCEQTIHYLSAL